MIAATDQRDAGGLQLISSTLAKPALVASSTSGQPSVSSTMSGGWA
jgi:hypothetical protein